MTRLTPTQRAERWGMPRLSEYDARAARVERMLRVLDRTYVAANHDKDPRDASSRMRARLLEWSRQEWLDLAQQADPNKRVKPPSEATRRALLDRLEKRAADAELAKTRVAADVYVCTVCGDRSCNRETCGEEAGVRGLSRYRRAS